MSHQDSPMVYDKNEELTEEMFKNENLHKLAQYTECNETQKMKINAIRYAFSEMYKCIDEFCNDSRETSLARTKLEEAQMWAIKGITREV